MSTNPQPAGAAVAVAPVPAAVDVATPAANATTTLAPTEALPTGVGDPSGTAAAGEALPRTLGRWRIASVTAAVLAGALSAALLLLGWQANRNAAASAEQLVRAENIQTSLLRADALATNAFLVAGLEPADQRAAYDTALDEVSTTITDAAQAEPADREVLAALNKEVLGYAGLVEQARSTNRQGLPVGAAYLKKASAGLRSGAIPLTDALVNANRGRASAAMAGHWPWLAALPALAALLVIAGAHRWVRRHFRRRVNLGLAGALLVVLGIGVLTVSDAWLSSTQNATLRDGDFATLVTGAEVRAAASDAKANESLRLISRGSGAANEAAWTADATTVTDGLQARPVLAPLRTPEWDAYAARHAAVVKLDGAGQWEEAVAEVTNPAAGAASATFTAFETALAAQVDKAARATATTLDRGNATSFVLAIAALVAGLVGAALAWRGITRRLEEYS